LSHFSLQFQREFTARSSKLKRDHRIEIEKKRERIPKIPNRFREEKKKENEEFHGFEPEKKNNERFTGLFPDFRPKINNRIQSKDFRRI